MPSTGVENNTKSRNFAIDVDNVTTIDTKQIKIHPISELDLDVLKHVFESVYSD